MSKKETIRWSTLKRKISGLEQKLYKIKRRDPGISYKKVADLLNKKFKNELDALDTKITWRQIEGVLTTFSYRRLIVDFIQDIRELEPNQVAKVLRKTITQTSYEKPIRINAKNSNNPKVLTLNAPLIGLGNNNKMIKRSLILAEKEKCDAVIIPGNLFWLDLKRYSSNKPLKSEFFITTGEETEPTLVFRDFKHKFDDLVERAKKQFRNSKGKKYFNGKILISLGKSEFELIKQYTNEIIRQIVMKEQSRLRSQKTGLERQLKKMPEYRKHEKNMLEERIDGVIKRLSYLKMTNVNEDYQKKIAQQMEKYIIYIYEREFGAQVASSSRVFVDISGLDFEIVQEQKDSKTNTSLGRMINSFRNEAKNRDLSHFILISGRTNQTYSGNPISYRSRKREIDVCYLEQLPCAVDNREAQATIKKQGKAGDPFLEAVSTSDFTSGVVIYEAVKEKNVNCFIPKKSFYSLEFLMNDQLFNGNKWNTSKIAYMEIDGDSHVGSAYITYYEIPKPPYFRYHFQMAHDFLEHLNAPIVGYFHVGDAINGHNHPYEARLPKNVKILDEIFKNFNKLTKKELMIQLIERGILPCQKQFDEYVEAMLDHKEYYLNIIRRSKKLGVKYQGDLAPIIFLGGNHFKNTVDSEVDDGAIIASRLRSELTDITDVDVKKLVLSPHFGDQSIGGGVINFKEEEYAVFVRHKAITGAAKYDDSTRKIRSANAKRGVLDPWQQGRYSIFLSGHTHRGGFTHGPKENFSVAGSQTFHTPFGDMAGFPLNYIASKIEGIPVRGLKWGPVVRIPLEYSFFKKTIKNWKKWKMDSKKLFKKAT